MSLLHDIINLVAPPQCVACSCRLSASESILCTACMAELQQTFYHRLLHSPSEKMLWGQLPIEKSVAFFYYTNNIARQLILSNKFRSRPEIGYRLGQIFATQLKAETSFFDGIDMIVPVPISLLRYAVRSYNQSYPIAQAVSRQTDIPLRADVVRKIKHTRPQTSLARTGRRTNVEGVFRVVKPEALHGRHVLLIDDVMTTGSTLLSLASEVAKIEGVRLSILTLAHATRKIHPSQQDDDIEYSIYGIPMLESVSDDDDKVIQIKNSK